MWQKLSTEVTNPRKKREGLRVRPSLTSLLLLYHKYGHQDHRQQPPSTLWGYQDSQQYPPPTHTLPHHRPLLTLLPAGPASLHQQASIGLSSITTTPPPWTLLPPGVTWTTTAPLPLHLQPVYHACSGLPAIWILIPALSAFHSASGRLSFFACKMAPLGIRNTFCLGLVERNQTTPEFDKGACFSTEGLNAGRGGLTFKKIFLSP